MSIITSVLCSLCFSAIASLWDATARSSASLWTVRVCAWMINQCQWRSSGPVVCIQVVRRRPAGWRWRYVKSDGTPALAARDTYKTADSGTDSGRCVCAVAQQNRTSSIHGCPNILEYNGYVSDIARCISHLEKTQPVRSFSYTDVVLTKRNE